MRSNKVSKRRKSSRKTPPRYIDLFAGCGGLSLGLEMAGFEKVFSVEKSLEAAATYYHNLIEPIGEVKALDWAREYGGQSLREQIASGLVIKDILEVVKELDKGWSKISEEMEIGEVDLIAGGPPCQGFSVAGRRVASDHRNSLAWHFLHIVEIVNPKAVIIENVEGMTRNFIAHAEESPFLGLADWLNELGYVVQPMLLNAKYYGVPQNRPRAFIVGIRQDLGLQIKSEARKIFSLERWMANGRVKNDLYKLVPPPTHCDNLINVEDAFKAIGDKEKIINSGKRAYCFNLNFNDDLPGNLKMKRRAGHDLVRNHEKRNHSPKVKARFSFMQALEKVIIKSNSCANRDVLRWQATGQLEKVESYINGLDKEQVGRFCELLEKKFHRIADWEWQFGKQKMACFRKLIVEFATKKHSQVVLRSKLPAPTVMTIPDDYVHYSEPRVMTVREEARLQSFPDLFEFKGSPTTGGDRRGHSTPQYSQVGNAVPPYLARALGNHVKKILGSS